MSVYAGVDPVTGKDLYLRESTRDEKKVPEIRSRLLAKVDQQRSAATNATLAYTVDAWPDGQGTWLYCAGIHAPGSRGGALYLAEHLPELHRETRGHLWSCLVRCDYVTDTKEISNAELAAPVRRRERPPPTLTIGPNLESSSSERAAF